MLNSISNATFSTSVTPAAGQVTGARQWPYILKKKAAAAVRMKQRSKDSAAKKLADLKTKIATAKARQQARDVTAKLKVALDARNAAAKAKQQVIAMASKEKTAAAKATQKTVAIKAAAKVKALIKARTLQAIKLRIQVFQDVFTYSNHEMFCVL